MRQIIAKKTLISIDIKLLCFTELKTTLSD